MPDAPQNPTPDPSRPLSEIGHLFLSSIRDRQTNGAPRPTRKGPTSSTSPVDPAALPNVSIDLTPEEFARAYGAPDLVEAKDAGGERKPEITAVIAAHLNGRQIDRTREYAAHLAATHGRIGLIELDASEFRLTLFERTAEGTTGQASDAATVTPEKLDARRMHEALEELSWDVDRWLLLLSNPRSPESRQLLNQIDRWTLLATCDHDGVVSCYRTVKGLCGDEKPSAKRPHMSLALLDVRSLDEADRVMLKLAGVCDQFLHWKLEGESVVKPAPQVVENLVLCCRATRESVGQPQFDVVRDLIARSGKANAITTEMSEPKAVATSTASTGIPVMKSISNAEEVIAALRSQAAVKQTVGPTAATVTMIAEPITASPIATGAIATGPIATGPIATGAISASPTLAGPTVAGSTIDGSEVIDLVGDDANPMSVVSAFVRGRSGLAETPVKAPGCPAASLAVSRDRQLVLVAVASHGLRDLRDIATAYRWLNENRPLIAMALPQFAIEPTHTPRLQLLVDQSDLRADVLQPLLQSAHVNVQTYRKLRWGGKTGLLLEAA